ncbi:MAG TPA: hypothetical protein DCS80_09785, partial [Betaproteobacteria bacterium]|nr:hypothetical protein [Betaproteobacteria bacterium]
EIDPKKLRTRLSAGPFGFGGARYTTSSDNPANLRNVCGVSRSAFNQLTDRIEEEESLILVRHTAVRLN